MGAKFSYCFGNSAGFITNFTSSTVVLTRVVEAVMKTL